MLESNTKQTSQGARLRLIGDRLARFIGAYGLNDAQRALLLRDSRAFMQLMLGEMVLAGWLHGNAYERWLGKSEPASLPV